MNSVINISKLTMDEKYNGVWLSGVPGEGEYKEWHKNNKLFIHCFYKNNKKHGRYRQWHLNGQLYEYCFYKNNKLDGEYKSRFHDGELEDHKVYDKGKLITIYRNDETELMEHLL